MTNGGWETYNSNQKYTTGGHFTNKIENCQKLFPAIQLFRFILF